MVEFWPRLRRRQKPFASPRKQKEENNQSKINTKPEVPENQTAWKSDNQGIKEKTTWATRLVRWTPQETQENRGKVAEGQGWLPSPVCCKEGTDLRGKLRLRADCGPRLGLPWWEILPVWQESPLESLLEMSRRAALFPLWPLPHRQLTRRVALPRWIPKAPSLTTYQVCQDEEIWPKWKNTAIPQN